MELICSRVVRSWVIENDVDGSGGWATVAIPPEMDVISPIVDILPPVVDVIPPVVDDIVEPVPLIDLVDPEGGTTMEEWDDEDDDAGNRGPTVVITDPGERENVSDPGEGSERDSVWVDPLEARIASDSSFILQRTPCRSENEANMFSKTTDSNHASSCSSSMGLQKVILKMTRF